MFSDAIAIKASALSKRYEIYASPRDRLKQFLIPRLARAVGRPDTKYFREFWALRDVSFTVEKGEAVAIVGRNGAGKSTLLQVLCGTLTPTAGLAEVRGRVAALLELGSGFSPDFTGLENVHLNAALLGLDRTETEARLDSILAFADIGDFINQPVKTYSSGMVVRLAFAVQAQVDPDVLIVDEALAVGDARFQAKCFSRIQSLRASGVTILLVTHSTEQVVSHCNRALLIEQGRLIADGNARDVANRYLDLLFGRRRFDSGIGERHEGDASADGGIEALDTGEMRRTLPSAWKDGTGFADRPTYNKNEFRWGDRRAEFVDYCMLHGDSEVLGSVETGAQITLVLKFKFASAVRGPILGITVKTKEGVTVSGTNTLASGPDVLPREPLVGLTYFVECSFKARLAIGDYFISVGLASADGEDVIPHDRRYDAIHFSIRPTNHFHGLADLDFDFSAATAEQVAA